MSDSKNVYGTLFSVQRYSVHDGPGIRTTVFLKGCRLRCLWCHNPESQKSLPELMKYSERCTACGACSAFCPNAFSASCTGCGRCVELCRSKARELCGRTESVQSVFDTVIRDFDYYEVSGGGVTLSGGEPLLQADFATALLKKCKEAGISTAIETAGFVPFDVFERVAPFTDLYLYDIKCMDSELHKRLTGVSNELILENAKRLAENGGNVIFRMPVVPGLNDSEVAAVSKFVGNGRLELMPYHNICAAKYDALGRTFATKDIEAVTDESIKSIASQFHNVIN